MREKARGLGIGGLKRHIFLCAEQTKPKCAPLEANKPAWDYLKKRLVEVGMMQGPNCVFRTKASCLKICDRRDDGAPVLALGCLLPYRPTACWLPPGRA